LRNEECSPFGQGDLSPQQSEPPKKQFGGLSFGAVQDGTMRHRRKSLLAYDNGRIAEKHRQLAKSAFIIPREEAEVASNRHNFCTCRAACQRLTPAIRQNARTNDKGRSIIGAAPGQLFNQLFKKASKSALIVSASVVGMPCGKPL
jgi:hypothetical protein